jgi:hypothetical protein
MRGLYQQRPGRPLAGVGLDDDVGFGAGALELLTE